MPLLRRLARTPNNQMRIHHRFHHAVRRERTCDLAEPAQHAILLPNGIELIEVRHAIEQRHDDCVGVVHGRANRGDGFIQVVRFAGQQDDVVFGLTFEASTVFAGTVKRSPLCSTINPSDASCAARFAHQKGDITPGFDKSPAEVAAGSTGAKDQEFSLYPFKMTRLPRS